MYCPECRYEYGSGITVCPDCEIALVDILPPKEKPAKKKKTPRMALRNLTLAVMIVTVYSFILSIARIIWPIILSKIALVYIYRTLNLVGGLISLSFFVVFLNKYVPVDNRNIRKGAIFGIIGATLDLLLDFKVLYVVFFSAYNFILIGPLSIGGWIYYIAAIFNLLFFVMFYIGFNSAEKARLKKTALFAGIATVFQATTLFLRDAVYFMLGRLGPITTNTLTLVDITILAIHAFVFVAYFLFFLTFYKEIDHPRLPAISPADI